jgi:hypothetical protein
VKSSEEVLSAVEAWKERRVVSGGPVQGLMPWEIMGLFEGIQVDGPIDSAVLNDLMLRAQFEIAPVLKRLAAEGKIVFDGEAVF